jgi:hypothetical protein
VFRQLGDTVGRVQALAALGRALVMAGHVDAGLDAVAEALVIDPAAPTLDDGGLVAVSSLLVRVQLGIVDQGTDAVDVAASIVGTGWEAGQSDIAMAAGLGLAQLGRVEEALALLERAGGEAPSASLGAAIALVRAAAGDAAGAESAVDRVRAAESSTYLDRATAAIALGLARTRGADPRSCAGVLEAFDAARAEIAPTDDVLADAVASLAWSVVATVLGRDDAARAQDEADGRWTVLGVEPTGWRRLFCTAAGLTHHG